VRIAFDIRAFCLFRMSSSVATMMYTSSPREFLRLRTTVSPSLMLRRSTVFSIVTSEEYGVFVSMSVQETRMIRFSASS
jgi:hypothetical protein